MDTIDDLDSVDTKPIEINDLSNTDEKGIFVNELINIPLVKGEKGDKGDQGIQGAKGDKGDKGDIGETGPAGATYDDSEIRGMIANKVDKIEGKGLSTNDFTDDLKQKLDDIGEGSFLPTGGTTGQVLAKASNVDGDVEWVDQTGETAGTVINQTNVDVATATLTDNLTFNTTSAWTEFKINFNGINNSNFTLQDGGIKIGKGISKVLVSASLGFTEALGGANQIYIKRNAEIAGRMTLKQQTEAYFNANLTEQAINVQEGDIITLTIASSAVQENKTIRKESTYMTVVAINNLTGSIGEGIVNYSNVDIATATLLENKSITTVAMPSGWPITKVILDKIDNNNFTLQDGGIKIGKGISKILISANLNLSNPTEGKYVSFIQKNGITVGNNETKETAGCSYLGLPLPTQSIDVLEGDIISFAIGTDAVKTMLARKDGTCVTIVAIKDAQSVLEQIEVNGKDIYSTEEKKIGVWEDGSNLYRKVINIGNLPNNSSKMIAHSISNLKEITRLKGITNIGGDSFEPIPMLGAIDNIHDVQITADKTNIYIRVNKDRSSHTAIVILEYTKNNDMASNNVEYIASDIIVSPTEPETDRRKVWLQKGKNLFNNENLNVISAWQANYSIDENKKITANCTGTSGVSYVKINSVFLKKGTYSFSANTTGQLQLVRIYKEDVLLETITGNTGTFTLEEDGNVFLQFYIWVSATGSITVQDIQIERGTEATAYEEYIDNAIYVKNDNDVYEKFMKKDEELYTQIKDLMSKEQFTVGTKNPNVNWNDILVEGFSSVYTIRDGTTLGKGAPTGAYVRGILITINPNHKTTVSWDIVQVYITEGVSYSGEAYGIFIRAGNTAWTRIKGTSIACVE